MTTAQSMWLLACISVFLQVAPVFLQGAGDPCSNYPTCANLPDVSLPDCTPNAKPTKIRECAENNVRNAKTCKPFVQRSLKTYAEGIRLAEKTLCETEGLRGAFVTQTTCWRGALGCVASHLTSSPGQDHTPDQCKTSVHSATTCTDQTTKECLPLHRRFVDHAIARTSCHGYNSSQKLGSSLLIVFLAVTISIWGR